MKCVSVRTCLFQQCTHFNFECHKQCMTLHWLHLPTYLFNTHIIARMRDIIRDEISLALAFLTNLRRYVFMDGVKSIPIYVMPSFDNYVLSQKKWAYRQIANEMFFFFRNICSISEFSRRVTIAHNANRGLINNSFYAKKLPLKAEISDMLPYTVHGNGMVIMIWLMSRASMHINIKVLSYLWVCHVIFCQVKSQYSLLDSIRFLRTIIEGSQRVMQTGIFYQSSCFTNRLNSALFGS